MENNRAENQPLKKKTINEPKHTAIMTYRHRHYQSFPNNRELDFGSRLPVHLRYLK